MKLTILVSRAALGIVALVFLARGTARLVAWDFTVPSFAVWGYPAWVAGLVAGVEIAGAFLILATPAVATGSGLLAAVAAGLTLTHAAFGDGWRAMANDALPLAGLAVAWWLRRRLGPSP